MGVLEGDDTTTRGFEGNVCEIAASAQDLPIYDCYILLGSLRIDSCTPVENLGCKASHHALLRFQKILMLAKKRVAPFSAIMYVFHGRLLGEPSLDSEAAQLCLESLYLASSMIPLLSRDIST